MSGERPGEPNMAELFHACSCGSPDCEDCSGWQLTPRTAQLLWIVAQLLADAAYDDVAESGDAVVDPSGSWSLFDEYPVITYRQPATWRRQAARAFDDLAADLAEGEWPTPRSPAEEMALHLILGHAAAAGHDHTAGEAFDRIDFDALPAHDDDFDWDGALEALFEDHDILALFSPELDGIEDPETEQNQKARMGDYRPESWFRWLDESATRDPGRGDRR